MNRLAVTLLCAMAALIAPAAAEDTILPGQWKVISTTVMNGAAMAPQVKARCLTGEQTADLGKTFGPVADAVNSACARTEYDLSGPKLKWRMQCKGQIDIDVSGNFNFDTNSHYTATVTSKGWMAGALMSDVKTELEGERVGACQ
jgi:hypothetical protein